MTTHTTTTTTIKSIFNNTIKFVLNFFLFCCLLHSLSRGSALVQSIALEKPLQQRPLFKLAGESRTFRTKLEKRLSSRHDIVNKVTFYTLFYSLLGDKCRGLIVFLGDVLCCAPALKKIIGRQRSRQRQKQKSSQTVSSHCMAVLTAGLEGTGAITEPVFTVNCPQNNGNNV